MTKHTFPSGNMQVSKMFEDVDNKYTKDIANEKWRFVNLDNKRHDDPTICALLYLQEKLGPHRACSGAEADMILLTDRDLDKLIPHDVECLYICGVRFDADYGCLYL